MKKNALLFTLLFVGVFLGNRVFNHVNAWLGISMIVAVIIFVFYKFFKTKKKDEELH